MSIAVHRVDHIHNISRLPSQDVSEVPTDDHSGAAGHGDVVRISRKRFSNCSSLNALRRQPIGVSHHRDSLATVGYLRHRSSQSLARRSGNFCQSQLGHKPSI
jgi:hypothetical protein